MRIVPLLASLLASAAPAAGVPVHFEINHTTTFGTSVYVLGDAPELGADDVTRAIKLSPHAYPVWQADVELPPGTQVQYRYLTRLDSASQVGNASNATFISPQPINLTVPGDPLAPRSGTVRYFSGADAPVLQVLQPGGGYTSGPFADDGPGRGPGERLWRADVTGLPPAGPWQFRIDLGTLGLDTPPYGAHYITALTRLWLQEGQIYSYRPAPAVSAPRVVKINVFHSALLNNDRPLYIYFPRGYDEHTTRRYPVIYMHDGQNVFQAFVQDSFAGSWRADETATLLISQGRMSECLIVGVGNTSDRFDEYIPPESGGDADLTIAMYRDEIAPMIDSAHRTLTSPEATAVCGSSLGGLLSAHFAWQEPSFARHCAGLSPSFQFGEIIARFASETPRDIRLWLDSGSAGGSGDGFANTYAARDALIANGYALGDTFQHFVAIGAGHSEAAWSARLDRVFLFLMPGTGETPTAPAGDAHGLALD